MKLSAEDRADQISIELMSYAQKMIDNYDSYHDLFDDIIIIEWDTWEEFVAHYKSALARTTDRLHKKFSEESIPSDN